jgi:hypothetical protein
VLAAAVEELARFAPRIVYTELLPLLELDEHELLRSTSDGKTHRITCRGERDPRGCFFKVAEVARVLNRRKLSDSVTEEESSFKAREDYVYMPREGQQLQSAVHPAPQIGGQGERPTHGPLLHLLWAPEMPDHLPQPRGPRLSGVGNRCVVCSANGHYIPMRPLGGRRLSSPLLNTCTISC